MALDLVSHTMQYLSPDLVGKIAQSLGLERGLATKAVGALVPGILGNLATSAGTPAGAVRLAEASVFGAL